MKRINFLLALLFALSCEYASGQTLSSQAANKIDNLQYIENKLETNGKAPVIVKLTITVESESQLKTTEKTRQRANLRNLQNDVITQLDDNSFTALKVFTLTPIISLHANAEAINRLSNLPAVEAIYPDRLSKPNLDASTAQIGADNVWTEGIEGSGKSVVILDTGIDLNHSFFSGKVDAEACFSTTSVENNSESLCPGGVASSTDPGSGAACDPSTVNAFCDHGSHVAGIAVGNDASKPLYGVARGANVIPIQVFSKFDDESFCGTGNNPCVASYSSDQISALEHVYNNLRTEYDISSVNMSLGDQSENASPCDGDPRKTPIDNLRSLGIATVIASGNDGHNNGLSRPACISTSVSVASVNGSDALSGFSNIASYLDLLAPGENIESSLLDNTYGNKSGTSMAAPHVAGAWALMQEAHPNATLDQILAALKETGVAVSDGGDTFSRIQVDIAVQNLHVASIAESTIQQAEGWRMLSSPVSSTYAELLDPLWTQGPLNSNAPGDASNTFTYEEVSSGVFDYASIDDLNNSMPVGSGLIVYVYDDQNFDGTGEGWPKPISVVGPENTGDVDVSSLVHPGSSSNNVYTLLGNPYNSTIDFDLFSNQSQIGNVVYVYDHSCDSFSSPDEDGGTEGGCFRAWNGSTGSLTDGLIAPFQGFFVFATGSDPTLTIPESSKTTGGTFYKNQPSQTQVMQIAARINGAYSGETWLSFTETGSVEKNSYDAPYLYPLDYRPFLSLQSRFNGTGYNIKNLPLNPQTSIEIPLVAEAWEPNQDEQAPGYQPLPGEVELIWPKMENIPEGWTITLTDHFLGKIIDMKTQKGYSYTTSPQKAAETAMPYKMELLKAVQKQSENTRFTITLSPNGESQIANSNLPNTFELHQNYPNPFNPTTVIRYELPEATEVTLNVYSVSGQRVATLVNQAQQAGSYTVPFDASRLASGMYIYQLKAGRVLKIQKMVLLK